MICQYCTNDGIYNVTFVHYFMGEIEEEVTHFLCESCRADLEDFEQHFITRDDIIQFDYFTNEPEINEKNKTL